MTYYRGNEPLSVSKERFKQKYIIAENGCFIWQGKPSTSGYGHFGVNGISEYAHRWAWFFCYSEWPAKWVLHSCDNPMCVNSAHLFIGDHADNMKDAAAKNRMGCPNKLSQQTRETIRAEHRAGGISQRALARKYRTTQSTVSEICRGLHDNQSRPQDVRYEFAIKQTLTDLGLD